MTFRRARPGDGATLFAVTGAAVAGLAAAHYPATTIRDWMAGRTVAEYEALIGRHWLVVAEPGVLTRLFVRPDAAGQGLGARLLEIGVAFAAADGQGPVTLGATLNARGFYERHGFRFVRNGTYRHALDSPEIAIAHMALSAERAARRAGAMAGVLAQLGPACPSPAKAGSPEPRGHDPRPAAGPTRSPRRQRPTP